MASVKGNKTSKIKYNLFDRGRKYNGIDRSNVDMQAMINLINSPKTQELVETNAMLGYYGHQIRQRYGMTPPETVLIQGKSIYLEPALRTIHLKAYDNGDVEHIAEFLRTEAGEYAKRQYVAQTGGFSTAITYLKNSNPRLPIHCGGFDYVSQPNWTNNNGDGELYDSLYLPDELNTDGVNCFDSMTDLNTLSNEQIVIAQQLEQSVLTQIDTIRDKLALQDIQLQEKKLQLQLQRQNEMFTGMIGTIDTDFDSMVRRIDEYADRVSLIELDGINNAEKSDLPDARKKPKWYNAFKR